MREFTEQELELGKAIWDLSREIERQDRNTRERQIFRWKKADYFWHTIQYLEETSQGFDSPELSPDEYDDVTGFTKCYNIYKSHGESIIAALSVDFPNIIFPPDDAENPDDRETSEAYERIADLIRKQNKAKLLLIKALFMLYNFGVACARTFPKESKKYGTYKVPIYGTEKVKTCPECQSVMNGSCPSCGFEGEGIEAEVPSVDSYEDREKTRQLIEVYSPLSVFIPSWTTDNSKISYIRLTEDEHEFEVKSRFPHIENVLAHDDIDAIEQWGRQSYDTINREGLLPVRSIWIKPCYYSGLPDSIKDSKILDSYPEGILAIFANDQLAEIRDEDLDSIWAISFDPRTRFIHSDPIGRPLVPVQEVTNELFNITLQSVEQGIPLTMADSDALDFEKFKQSPALPGQIYPVKPRPGKSVSESFETLKTASVSQEIEKFADRLEQMGQFVVGSFPSIYGGRLEGSRTAAEYNMSRQQALQRLSTSWVIITYFWAELTEKSCKGYVKNVKTDEKFVKKEGNSYINVWIRKSELTGKVGECEPEIVEQFPVSSVQKRDAIATLLEMKSPEINQVLFHPANRSTIARYSGFNDLYIPGENDQNKQYSEIEEMLKSAPIGEGQPSVMTDPEIDDALVHIQTCRSFLTSDRGRIIRVENPDGWNNVFFHMKLHEQDQLGKTALPTENSAPGEVPETAATTTGA